MCLKQAKLAVANMPAMSESSSWPSGSEKTCHESAYYHALQNTGITVHTPYQVFKAVVVLEAVEALRQALLAAALQVVPHRKLPLLPVRIVVSDRVPCCLQQLVVGLGAWR